LAAIVADHTHNNLLQIVELETVLANLRERYERNLAIMRILDPQYQPTPVGERILAFTPTAVDKAVKAGHPTVDTVTCPDCGKTMGRMGLFRHRAIHKVDTLKVDQPLPAPTPIKPQPVKPGVDEDRMLLVRCDDCDIAYPPHQLRQLAEHCRIAHRRPISRDERTPRVA
jgi:hypothetical protein